MCRNDWLKLWFLPDSRMASATASSALTAPAPPAPPALSLLPAVLGSCEWLTAGRRPQPHFHDQFDSSAAVGDAVAAGVAPVAASAPSLKGAVAPFEPSSARVTIEVGGALPDSIMLKLLWLADSADGEALAEALGVAIIIMPPPLLLLLGVRLELPAWFSRLGVDGTDMLIARRTEVGAEVESVPSSRLSLGTCGFVRGDVSSERARVARCAHSTSSHTVKVIVGKRVCGFLVEDGGGLRSDGPTGGEVDGEPMGEADRYIGTGFCARASALGWCAITRTHEPGTLAQSTPHQRHQASW